MNSIGNRFDQFSKMIHDKTKILITAETKLDSSFPSGQFSIKGFKTPLRLDVNENNGRLLSYIKENILSKELRGISIPDDIQAVPIEINIRKTKWLIVPIYRRPTRLFFFMIRVVLPIMPGRQLGD